MAYDPVMSADQHWLIMRASYSLHTEVTIPEMYLLYDLTATRKKNEQVATPFFPETARVIYPVVPKHVPFNRADVPDSEEHRFRSRRFYWAPDSESLVFVDSVQEALSIVLVKLANGKIQTYVHPVSRSEACMEGAASADTSDLTLTHAEISPDPVGGPVVRTEFEGASSGPRCTPKQLMLRFDDFQPARTEVYTPRQRKQAVPMPPR